MSRSRQYVGNFYIGPTVGAGYTLWSTREAPLTDEDWALRATGDIGYRWGGAVLRSTVLSKLSRHEDRAGVQDLRMSRSCVTDAAGRRRER